MMEVVVSDKLLYLINCNKSRMIVSETLVKFDTNSNNSLVTGTGTIYSMQIKLQLDFYLSIVILNTHTTNLLTDDEKRQKQRDFKKAEVNVTAISLTIVTALNSQLTKDT